MPRARSRRNVVVVAGDVTMDWNLAEYSSRQGATPAWSGDLRTRINFQPGGACLLAEVLRRVTKADVRSVRGVELFPSRAGVSIFAGDRRFHHSTSVWSKHERSAKAKEEVWRLREFQGFAQAQGAVEEWSVIANDSPDAKIIVLDDANLGLRTQKRLWPRALRRARRPRSGSAAPPWVIMKTADPIAQGPLTDYLLERFAERLIVIMTVGDVRRTEAQISSRLSWESTAQDLAWEFSYNRRLTHLSGVHCIVVSLGPAGVWLSLRKAGSSRNGDGFIARDHHLLFDKTAMEGTWEGERPGGMIGYTTCLTAAIAQTIDASPEDRRLVNGQKLLSGASIGLAAMQTLHETGFIEDADGNLGFPFDAIKPCFASTKRGYGNVKVPLPTRRYTVPGAWINPGEETQWSILRAKHINAKDLMKVAENIVLEGPAHVLQDVPLGRFGDLLTADRGETEGFRSIHNLVAQYRFASRQSRPLSIAVFGPPGSGKSFGIEEVTKSLGGNLFDKKTFNLSQFNSPNEIIAAMHQVRDVGLSGKIPLVFWDEFDTPLEGKQLGWLRYFLAPMQDGKFQEGQITHNIGRAIFVFAGGTNRTIGGFRQTCSSVDKGPDFLSRLRGFVNIMGPNRTLGDVMTNPGYIDSDPYHLIRRAILLRSIVELNVPQILRDNTEGDVPKRVAQIDRGLLRALLGVWEYRHGARSIESILAMSELVTRTSFQRSSLPAKEQLDLHVNGREFLGLLLQAPLEDEALVWSLGRHYHEQYCKVTGFQGGWDDVSGDYRQSSIDAVRAIPYQLASIGYTYLRVSGRPRLVRIPDKNAVLLAEIEHDRWIVSKIDQGWTYGETKNAKSWPMTHPDLVPYWSLDQDAMKARYPETIWRRLGAGPLKNPTDLELIKSIPEILAREKLALAQLQ